MSARAHDFAFANRVGSPRTTESDRQSENSSVILLKAFCENLFAKTLISLGLAVNSVQIQHKTNMNACLSQILG